MLNDEFQVLLCALKQGLKTRRCDILQQQNLFGIKQAERIFKTIPIIISKEPKINKIKENAGKKYLTDQNQINEIDDLN